jgi:L-2-hydroxyglutarate oxidase LhgO
VVSGDVSDHKVTVETGGKDPARLGARCVVNAAGLMAARIASRFEGLAIPPPEMKFAKGNYFGVATRVPFSRLVYPVPEAGGLGVHLTLDLAGRARFGPDVEWIDEIDFSMDQDRAEPFYRAIRRYWPDLPDGSLHADYCGIRPKIAAQATADFVIEAGNGRFISLYGIESPGLTSCLAIATEVAALVDNIR